MGTTKTVGKPKTGVGKVDTTASGTGYNPTARTNTTTMVGTGTETTLNLEDEEEPIQDQK